MLRFFTCVYAVTGDIAFAALAVFGGLGLALAGPSVVDAFMVLTLAFIAYANLLMLTGRRFSRLGALAAVLAGAGVPLVVVALAVVVFILVGFDVFS